MDHNMPHWLTKRAELTPEKIAIEYENAESLTFLELRHLSESYARKLARMNVKPGDNVALLSFNDPKMIIALYALSYLGATAVLLNARLTDEELLYQIKDAEVSLLLIGQSVLPHAFMEETIDVPVKLFTDVDQESEADVELRYELSLNDSFTIIYTSGTTGKPKGVVHTYGNHWWSAISSSLNLGLAEDDKWLAMLPMFHVGGLSIYLKSVIYGMTVFFLQQFQVEKVNQLIQERNITIVSVVTVMLKQLVEQLGERHYPKSLRCMLLGGGSCPESLLQLASEKNIPVIQSYGMTETSSQIVTLSFSEALRKINSSGKALFPAQMKILNPDKDGVGEICVKGPMVAKSYYGNDEATRAAFVDDWLKTGDLGYLDEEGFLYVIDRRTDLIISGGENIYPSEIEHCLMRMNEIQDTAVIGVDDEKWGQTPLAFVVTRTKISKESIYAFLEGKVARYKLPKEIIFIDELPRNASNKIMKYKLQAYANEALKSRK